MAFVEIVDRVIALLRDRARISYRVLKREFALDNEQLEDLKAELLDAQRVARDEDGKVLVWIGDGIKRETDKGGNGEDSPESKHVQGPKPKVQSQEDQPPTPSTQPPTAERRQLTVMFCDLVGSTALSTQLDPEDLREVVQKYQQTCAEVIQRHEGYIAQYLGDGLLVYFGYPAAHEDDARRAVRTGLEIITTLQKQVPSPLVGEGQGEGATGKDESSQVRIGIHTGLVVVGEIGTSEKRELLALGETPNIAARVQGLAEPNTVIISAATQRLVEGQFESQPFGSHMLKGIETPIAVYHVQSERQSGSHSWR